MSRRPRLALTAQARTGQACDGRFIVRLEHPRLLCVLGCVEL
jgi:hypothetical protein